MIGHGLLHLMGFALFLRLAEPGELRYSTASPEPGSLVGVLIGLLWLTAAAGFLTAGLSLLIRRGFWRWLGLGSAALSVPLVTTNLQTALTGLIVDALIIVITAALLRPATLRNIAGVDA